MWNNIQNNKTELQYTKHSEVKKVQDFILN